MKIKSLLICSLGVLALSSCQEKIPTACECYSALKTEGREAKIYAKCQEMREADVAFADALTQCAADDILKGNTKVQRSSGDDLELPANGMYNLDAANSAITWTGEKITGKNHFGSILFKSGTIQFENKTIVGGELMVDMSSISVIDLKDEESNAKLTSHLNSPDFFDTAKFQEAKYTVTSVEARENNSFKIQGSMTIKGITQEVSSDIFLTLKQGTLVGGGTVTFDRSKFDVRYGSGSFFDDLGDDLIKDEITLKVKIIATPEVNPA